MPQLTLPKLEYIVLFSLRVRENKLFKNIDIAKRCAPQREISLHRRLALQRPMVLMELVHEPAIRRCGGPTRAHELERLSGMQSMRSNEIPTNDRDRSRRAHRTMNQHARLWACAQRTRDISRCTWEMCGKFCERRVVQGDLRSVWEERSWERDAAWHCGEYMSNSECCERRWVLCRLQIGDVESREDFGDVRRGGGGHGCCRSRR